MGMHMVACLFGHANGCSLIPGLRAEPAVRLVLWHRLCGKLAQHASYPIADIQPPKREHDRYARLLLHAIMQFILALAATAATNAINTPVAIGAGVDSYCSKTESYPRQSACRPRVAPAFSTEERQCRCW